MVSFWCIMVKGQTTLARTDFWFYIFIFLHIVVWTLTPLFVRFTLPMDAMEGVIWGQQFEWGYDKNPFLNGWITGLAANLSDYSDWLIYACSQIAVALCFWATWQLGKKILPPLYALLGVLLLEGIQYYHLHAIDLSDNTLELACWAFTTLFFYQALRWPTYRNWLLTGLFAGLSMMTKYYSILLLLSMFGFLLRTPENRQQLKTWPPYFALIIFLIMITPHFIWVWHHDFITIHYALERVSSTPNFFNHIKFPFLFISQQIETLLPLFLLFAILYGRNKSNQIDGHCEERFFAVASVARQSNPETSGSPRLNASQPRDDEAAFSGAIRTVSQFDKQFLLYLGLGPFLLTISLSLLFGIHLRAGWGSPLFSLIGIILFANLRPEITTQRLRYFFATLLASLALTITFYSEALIIAKKPSSANFPGKMIANTLQNEWDDLYHTPISYVCGSRWLAGNIAFYSQNHPSVFIDWNKKISPWINEESLRKAGGIFVWDLKEKSDIPPAIIYAQYKTLGSLHIMHFSWLRNKKMPPVEIGVAFLPPQSFSTEQG